MIIEERIYTVEVGKAGEYSKLMDSEGIAIQEPILGKLFGCFFTEFGPLNQVIHMWEYDSFEERAKRRKQLMSDKRWLDFLVKLRPLIKSQENKLLVPMPFSPPLRHRS